VVSFRVAIAVVEIVLDRFFEVVDAVENTPLDTFLGYVPEEPLDHVDPRGRGRREVQVEPGMTVQLLMATMPKAGAPPPLQATSTPATPTTPLASASGKPSMAPASCSPTLNKANCKANRTKQGNPSRKPSGYHRHPGIDGSDGGRIRPFPA